MMPQAGGQPGGQQGITPPTQQMRRTYRSAVEMQRGIAQMAKQGWRVMSTMEHQPRTGCMRFFLLGLFSLIFKPKPQFIVTFARHLTRVHANVFIEGRIDTMSDDYTPALGDIVLLANADGSQSPAIVTSVVSPTSVTLAIFSVGGAGGSANPYERGDAPGMWQPKPAPQKSDDRS